MSVYPKGASMLLGYEYAWNEEGSTAVLLLGKMTCTRPKRP